MTAQRIAQLLEDGKKMASIINETGNVHDEAAYLEQFDEPNQIPVIVGVVLSHLNPQHVATFTKIAAMYLQD